MYNLYNCKFSVILKYFSFLTSIEFCVMLMILEPYINSKKSKLILMMENSSSKALLKLLKVRDRKFVKTTF